MADSITEVAKKAQENFVRANRIFILGPFDRSISEKVIPDFLDLIDLIKTEKEPVIEIYINSHGGYASELMGLLSVIQMAKSFGIKIVTYNIGVAYSCGSLLAVIGDYKFMYRYADNLPHLGQACMCPQTFEQLNRNTKHIASWFNTIADIYAKHTKVSKKELIKILKDDDYHMDADECLKKGFCDEII